MVASRDEGAVALQGGDRREEAMDEIQEVNPKPSTLNPASQILNLESSTSNPQSYISNLRSKSLKPNP